MLYILLLKLTLFLLFCAWLNKRNASSFADSNFHQDMDDSAYADKKLKEIEKSRALSINFTRSNK